MGKKKSTEPTRGETKQTRTPKTVEEIKIKNIPTCFNGKDKFRSIYNWMVMHRYRDLTNRLQDPKIFEKLVSKQAKSVKSEVVVQIYINENKLNNTTNKLA